MPENDTKELETESKCGNGSDLFEMGMRVDVYGTTGCDVWSSVADGKEGCQGAGLLTTALVAAAGGY